MSHDPSTTPNRHFPRLTPANHRITSPMDPAYNCAAWAAGESDAWWEPGYYWPVSMKEGLMSVFESLGYSRADVEPDLSVECVVIFECDGEETHVARRMENGLWTSKLGKWQDIEHHTVYDVAGGIYGDVRQFMIRERK